MTLDQIRSDFETGRRRALTLDVRLSPEFPGYVRTVTLRDGNRVNVEFEQYGYDEGGAYFWGQYATLEDAVRALEEYVQSPVSAWVDLDAKWRLPIERPDGDPQVGSRNLAAAIRENSVPLPKGTRFELRSSYWQQFQPHADSRH